MTKETKTIKELKKVNDKLRNQYRLLDIRYHALNSSYQRLKKEKENLANKLIEIYKYEYGTMSDEELLQIIKEIKEDDKEC